MKPLHSLEKGNVAVRKNFPKIDVYKTGQNIKQIMIAHGISVKDIQEYLGLSAPQSIYHWFEGRSLPTVDNLYALSDLFGMPVDFLLRGNRKENFYSHKHSAFNRLIMYYEKYHELQAG
jgi:transcriptional regulator with XRE-family HTH domain